MKKIIVLLFIFLSLFLAGCGKKEDVLENLPDFSGSEQGGVTSEKNLQLAEVDMDEEQRGDIKVLSGNFFPVKGQDGKSVVGVRLIGEIQNTGEEVIEDVSSVVRFFDVNEKEVGVKVSEFFPGFEFLPIEPGKVGLFDLFISEPPASERTQFLMEIKKPKEQKKKVALQFVTKQVVEREQEVAQQQEQQLPGSTPSAQSTQKVKYLSCFGSFFNDQKMPIKDTVVLIWVKNKEDKVFGYGMKKFTQDLLLPGKSQDFEINFLPFVEEKMVSFEIRVFGEEYQ